MGERIDKVESDGAQSALPYVPYDDIPVFLRSQADEWERLSRDRQSAALNEFRETASRFGIAGAKRLPWWPILANLTVAPLFADD